METKVCKQCGRELTQDKYRKYPSGASYHTVCIECENFNQLVNVAYRKDESKRSEAQKELLEKAKTLYEALYNRGLEPKGRYASDVLGIPLMDRRLGGDVDAYIEELMNNE